MSLILEMEEKLGNVASNCPEKYTMQDLFTKFIELYPEDWKNIKAAYSRDRRMSKPRKSIPLPKPEIYMRNIINTWLKKTTK
jgi:hypothetical protein